jgi:hypothetical protein
MGMGQRAPHWSSAATRGTIPVPVATALTTTLQFIHMIHVARRGATAGAIALLLAGCAGFDPFGRGGGAAPPAPVPAATPTTEPAPAAAPAPLPADGPPTASAPLTRPGQTAHLSDADRREVRRLLRAADYAITDNQLVDPPGVSALARYQQVLQIDPENPDARYGIQGIVDRLVERARAAGAQRRFQEAERVLAQAREVDPEHPGIEPAHTQIALVRSSRRESFPLDPAGVDNRAAPVVARLREAGAASRAPGCRAIIRARNDAEGRWIYQAMSAAPGSDRIRAEILISRTPGVENVCYGAGQ